MVGTLEDKVVGLAAGGGGRTRPDRALVLVGGYALATRAHGEGGCREWLASVG